MKEKEEEEEERKGKMLNRKRRGRRANITPATGIKEIQRFPSGYLNISGFGF